MVSLTVMAPPFGAIFIAVRAPEPSIPAQNRDKTYNIRLMISTTFSLSPLASRLLSKRTFSDRAPDTLIPAMPGHYGK
jgi:hypothetical protein